jgi:hypothetical protein
MEAGRGEGRGGGGGGVGVLDMGEAHAAAPGHGVATLGGAFGGVDDGLAAAAASDAGEDLLEEGAALALVVGGGVVAQVFGGQEAAQGGALGAAALFPRGARFVAAAAVAGEAGAADGARVPVLALAQGRRGGADLVVGRDGAAGRRRGRKRGVVVPPGRAAPAAGVLRLLLPQPVLVGA